MAPLPESWSPSVGRTLALVSFARQGNRPAMEELFERLLPRVRKVVALRMSCHESELWEREDLVQETLRDAFQGLERFRGEHEGALCHWLASLVQNNLTDHRRRRTAKKRDVRRVVTPQRGSTALSDSVLGTDRNTPSRLAQARELERKVEEALLALDQRQRRAIEMRRLCQLSFAEIAKELELGSEASARAFYSRAMSAFAELL